MIVRESLDFEREGSPLKRLNIGILTWDKLKPGDILQNKRTIYPVMTRLYFSQNEDNSDYIKPEKYWTINKIHQEDDYLNIELVWSGVFRHAVNIAERIIKHSEEISRPLYSSNHSIEEWDDWFKIIQPKEYELEESVNFERGADPKVSMDIGNKWTRIKPGDIIECIRENVVREKNNQDFLNFEDYISGNYMGDRDYYFEIGNVAMIKYIVDLGENAGLRISIIPFSSEIEARGAIKQTDSQNLEYLSKTLYSTIKGTAPISTWGKYFKVL